MFLIADGFETMLASILPVFFIISLGAGLRHFRLMPDQLFPSIEKFSYNVAYPALLFGGTARLSFDSAQVGELALATLIPTFLIVAVTLLAMRCSDALPDPSRSSVVQGAARPNSYFGIAVSALLFEPPAAALVMLTLAVCLPVVNTMSIVALSWWGGGKTDVKTVFKMLFSNPIILSTLAGMLVSIAGVKLALPLSNTLDILGKSALALGLISVGGGLIFSLQGLRPITLTLTSALKLLAMPLLAAKVCLLLGVSSVVAPVACFYCSLPTAPNAYIMSKQMGGDARLMASLITLQTLLAALTVPVSREFLPWLM